jgi:hypothetical protein
MPNLRPESPHRANASSTRIHPKSTDYVTEV